MKFIILAVAAAAAALAGCAANSTTTAAEPTPPSELVYRTGSNIPVRNRAPATPEEKERQAEESKRALESMQRTGAGTPLK